MAKQDSAMDYREAFLQKYHELRGQHLSGDLGKKRRLFMQYFDRSYKSLLPVKKDAHILDIGFGEGIFLYWASENGYTKLEGVDPCTAFVEMANEIKNVKAYEGSAMEFLEKSGKNKYDAITIKAVMEHIPKHEIFPLIQRMYESLKPGGVLIVDVPNMDWFFAQHERYLDFTHEVGYTQESLRDILGFFFDDVSIHFPPDSDHGSPVQWVLNRTIRPLTRFIFKLFLYLLSSEGMSSFAWHSRSVIGRAVKKG